MGRISTSPALLPPCTYQGGKQRISKEIVTIINEREQLLKKTPVFYDLCCGSGAVTLELIRRGFPPSQIRMCDISPWGTFWKSIGEGLFDLSKFSDYIATVPQDKNLVQIYMNELAKTSAREDTEYKFLLLQAAAFGGKQVWRDGSTWRHSSFRSYWLPTNKSVRQSPVNPIQPQPNELFRRVEQISHSCAGLQCFNEDISTAAEQIPKDKSCVVYIDPPYPSTTHYGHSFSITPLIDRLLQKGVSSVYVSLNEPLSEDAVRLHFGGAKGGISGNKKGKGQEWLSMFRSC